MIYLISSWLNCFLSHTIRYPPYDFREINDIDSIRVYIDVNAILLLPFPNKERDLP